MDTTAISSTQFPESPEAPKALKAVPPTAPRNQKSSEPKEPSGSHNQKTPTGSGELEMKAIGKYTLGRTLGQGTFGKVKQGVHTPTGELVAVKVLEKSRMKTQSDVQRVQREIRIHKALRHPYIAQLYEIIDTPKNIFLVMEFCEGGELFNYIVSSRRIHERDACKFFHMIVDAVDFSHQQRVIHRDLKPENVLLSTRNPQMFPLVKLIDFGLSNSFEEGESSLLKTACGSPCYASPEMISGQEYDGQLTDIWSLGVVLYAMVCGFLPFEDENLGKLYDKILSGQFEEPVYLSSGVVQLLHGILCVDPNHRLSLEDVRSSEWYNQIAIPPCSKNPRPFDRSIANLRYSRSNCIQQWAVEMGRDFEKVRMSYMHNLHNDDSVFYYLLEKKFLRDGKAPLSHGSGIVTLPKVRNVSAAMADTPLPRESITSFSISSQKAIFSVAIPTVPPPQPPHPPVPPPPPPPPSTSKPIYSYSPIVSRHISRPYPSTATSRFSPAISRRTPDSARNTPIPTLTHMLQRAIPVTERSPTISTFTDVSEISVSSPRSRGSERSMATSTTGSMVTPIQPKSARFVRPGRKLEVNPSDLYFHFTKSPFESLMDVKKVLNGLEIKFSLSGSYSIVGEKLGVVLELAIVPTQKEGVRYNSLCIHYKRGDRIIYQNVARKILDALTC